MGQFTRSGTFQDKTRFLTALKSRVAALKDGALRGMTEKWEDGPANTTVTLAGFGARLLFTVNNGDWACTASIPDWLPLPQAMIEQKFDKEFEELKGL